MNERELELACPSCGSVIEIVGQSIDFTCPVCNGHIALAGHLCPSCDNYDAEEQTTCAECGSPLVRLCRNCLAVNWTGDVKCVQCGEPIDMLSQVNDQSRQSDAERLGKQMLEATDLKNIEAVASERRMAELMAIEEARQAELRKERLKRTEHERRMLTIVFATVLLFLLVLVAYALLSYF